MSAAVADNHPAPQGVERAHIVILRASQLIACLPHHSRRAHCWMMPRLMDWGITVAPHAQSHCVNDQLQ